MTNTLTVGEFDLKEIVYYSPYNKNLLLDYLYNLEKLSADPIAKAIVKNLRRRDNFSYFIASKNINDIDIWAKTYENEEIKIGSKDFVNVEDDSNEKAIFMSINNILVCKVVLEDNIKDDAKESIDYLKNEFSDIAVLSAEKEKVVENLAKNLGISYAAEISANEKVELINNEQKNKHKIISLILGIATIGSLFDFGFFRTVGIWIVLGFCYCLGGWLDKDPKVIGFVISLLKKFQ